MLLFHFHGKDNHRHHHRFLPFSYRSSEKSVGGRLVILAVWCGDATCSRTESYRVTGGGDDDDDDAGRRH